MAVTPYYAEYCRFDTQGKSNGAFLIGADSLVGDLFKIVFETNDEGKTVAKLHNKFDMEVGVFDNRATYRLQLCQADGWEVHAILSAVFLSTAEDGGAHYSGEALLMCFSKRYSEEFNIFMDGVRKQIANGKRPDVDLKPAALREMIDAGGNWTPTDYAPKRKLESGTVVVKDYMKHDEKMIEMARDRNAGCMAVGWAFIIIVIVGIIWLLTRIFM